MPTSAQTAVAPHWSADELAAAIPRSLPPLHTVEFMPPANAAQMHRPSRRMSHGYSIQPALPLFRVAN
jgi:hypothetical protein